MKFVRSHLLVATAAATVTAVVLGGIAWATIPNNMNGDITACVRAVKPDKGSVRIIDRQEGRACHKGEDMVTWSTRGFKWRGQWNSHTKYKANDVVGYNGSSYIASKATTNVLPSSTGYWSLMTAAGGGQGAVGPTGAAGATGPAGATGAAGPTGPSQTCTGYPHNGIDWSVPGSTAGNGCDLHGANLSGAHLVGANLTNANLTSADLSGANLTGADLTGATITGIVSTSTIWSDTICPDGQHSNANGTSPESC
jgi:hypothetical protein